MPVKTDVKVKTIPYVMIYVKDTEKATPFYRDTLGLRVKSEHPGWVEFDTGSTILALHGDEKHVATNVGSSAPVVVLGVENIKEAHEHLREAGIKFSNEPHMVCEEGDHVGMCADFKDPDGNPLSLFGMVKK